ncbi:MULTISPECIES: class II fructose-bisphosphate aldolase [unclassified Rhodococcus (in: high G+C Gram-positive bacteria)]|uniref:class II fructose-bisphosphate aldolase n=1 Tax=unclassified Rhodococcus (in: high G+C Gram-positive bacteria) TaxID=192944 RepID=UPI0006FFD0D8|nr:MULTISPECIES: class II fructose-bisphosphate aldolase [unclassified Rhodococcus (in: high G+C Gram-positive bacteria)]KQU28454.1 fructose-bisphosphate aldolase [Rhodococcus sp. Leaf225]KQU47667.1 fructose-bisphosphate aldolase [Rhodococcus sp. Leaf258]
MRARLDDLVADALRRGSAVPAFTCYDFTTAMGVVAAAETSRRGTTLLIAPKTAAAQHGARFITALRGLADDADIPVTVQLDHAANLDVIATAVAAGADSVLVDGSSLSYENNIALVRAAREIVGPDIVLEAELGGLPGDEDRALAASPVIEPGTGLTDPSSVTDFVSRTGIGLLAVAIGNVHGTYSGEPQLQWDLLRDIGTHTSVPLVLHGASGIPTPDLVRATRMGVGKININTELRTSVLDLVERELPSYRTDGENLLGLLGRWDRVVREFASATLDTLNH